MTKQLGRDDERARQKKAAPSHTTETHKKEAERNKKEEAGLRTKAKRPISK